MTDRPRKAWRRPSSSCCRSSRPSSTHTRRQRRCRKKPVPSKGRESPRGATLVPRAAHEREAGHLGGAITCATRSGLRPWAINRRAQERVQALLPAGLSPSPGSLRAHRVPTTLRRRLYSIEYCDLPTTVPARRVPCQPGDETDSRRGMVLQRHGGTKMTLAAPNTVVAAVICLRSAVQNCRVSPRRRTRRATIDALAT